MIVIKSNLLRISAHEPKMVEYPSGVKKFFIKGTSSKFVPPQNLHITTGTFSINPNQFLNNSEFDITFNEF